jgi:hypothetical protein
MINVSITCCLFIMGANVPRLGDDDLQSPWGGFDSHCLHHNLALSFNCIGHTPSKGIIGVRIPVGLQ